MYYTSTKASEWLADVRIKSKVIFEFLTKTNTLTHPVSLSFSRSNLRVSKQADPK